MSLKITITDIMTRLRTIPELNFVHVFNNQFAYMETGEGYSFPMPCAFIEVVNQQQYNQLLNGYQQADIDIRVHIGQEQYDSGDGNMEQNLTIHDLRDLVFAKLSLFKPTMCTEMFKVNEGMDYEHTNVYHYTIDFRTGFIDNTASTLITPTLIEPIELEIESHFVHNQFDDSFNDDFANEWLPNIIDKREIII